MLDFIQWRARKTPEAQALFFNGRWYTYREMEGRANRLANRLRALGVRQGDAVAVLAINHPIHFDLLFAAPKLGFVFAPLPPQADAAALARAVALIRPVMLFVDSRHESLAQGLGCPWTRLSDYREWLAIGSLDTPAAPPRTLDVEDVQVLYCTPRGVARLPYRQVLLNARHSADAWGLSAQDATIHCLPCGGAELNLIALPMLYRGGRVVLMTRYDSDEFLGHCALHRVSVAALAPQMLRQLVLYSDFEDADLTSLNWIGTVGGVAPARVADRFAARGVPLRILMPLAEAGPNLFNSNLSDTAERPALLGLPMPDLRIALRRPDGSPAATGEVGELVVSGAMLFRGHIGEEEAGTPVPAALATGQMLREERDGQYLWLGGRESAFVHEGRSAHPAEIEQALLRIDAVADCAVAPLPDDEGLFAAVVLHDGHEGSEADVQAVAAQLWAHLPESLMPRRWLLTRQILRDGWGQLLREPLLAELSRAS